MKRLPLFLIHIYQLFSRGLPPRCRFTPSCSEYACEAIELHGIMRGLLLGTKRILKCHPFHEGGYDPVPPVKG